MEDFNSRVIVNSQDNIPFNDLTANQMRSFDQEMQENSSEDEVEKEARRQAKIRQELEQQRQEDEKCTEKKRAKMSTSEIHLS